MKINKFSWSDLDGYIHNTFRIVVFENLFLVGKQIEKSMAEIGKHLNGGEYGK